MFVSPSKQEPKRHRGMSGSAAWRQKELYCVPRFPLCPNGPNSHHAYLILILGCCQPWPWYAGAGILGGMPRSDLDRCDLGPELPLPLLGPAGGGGTYPKPVGFGTLLAALLLLLLLRRIMAPMQLAMPRMTIRPTTTATGMTMSLLSWIHDLISSVALAPVHAPFSHLPPPWQDVPSRKFWFSR